MNEISIIIDADGDNFQLYFHPESLVMMTYDLKQDGLSDEDIAIKLEELRRSILTDYLQKIESGELDLEDFEGIQGKGCGDPTCPNCGTGIVYH
jgi:hypothetical protein